jgi:hypothetical protein
MIIRKLKCKKKKKNCNKSNKQNYKTLKDTMMPQVFSPKETMLIATQQTKEESQGKQQKFDCIEQKRTPNIIDPCQMLFLKNIHDMVLQNNKFIIYIQNHNYNLEFNVECIQNLLQLNY